MNKGENAALFSLSVSLEGDERMEGASSIITGKHVAWSTCDAMATGSGGRDSGRNGAGGRGNFSRAYLDPGKIAHVTPSSVGRFSHTMNFLTLICVEKDGLRRGEEKIRRSTVHMGDDQFTSS